MICFLISTGHGAAACITRSRLDTSYELRTASGSFSIRVNITGTNCPCVTRWRAMASRVPSASKRSITTTGMPAAWNVIDHTLGAVWYSGAGLRYTPSGLAQKDTSVVIKPGACEGGRCDSARLMPLGRPVVPDEYCSRSPSISSSMGVTGCAATHCG